MMRSILRTKKKTTAPEYVTREILKEEISASEQRLDAKIDSKVDSAVQSMKEYTDSRIQQVNMNIKEVGESVHHLQQIVEKQGEKTDRYFEGIVKMIEGLHGRESIVEERLQDHEECITVLEEKE